MALNPLVPAESSPIDPIPVLVFPFSNLLFGLPSASSFINFNQPFELTHGGSRLRAHIVSVLDFRRTSLVLAIWSNDLNQFAALVLSASHVNLPPTVAAEYESLRAAKWVAPDGGLVLCAYSCRIFGLRYGVLIDPIGCRQDLY